DCFATAKTCHGVVESEELADQARQLSHETTKIPAASDGTVRARMHAVELDGRRFEVKAIVPEPPYTDLARRRRERTAAGAHGAAKDAVVTPMQGTVLTVEVSEGEEVHAGQVICVVEAMKMENEITAHREGTVSELSVEPGQPVKTGQVVCVDTQNGA